MRIPDWLIYGTVFIVVVSALFMNAPEPETAPVEPLPEAPPPSIALGPELPAPSALDEQILVEVGEAADGMGTAFAINDRGAWLTARHVVDGCADVALAVGTFRAIPVSYVYTSKQSDLALLVTSRAPSTVPLDLERPLHLGEQGFHVGYPQGRAGEAASQLVARSTLATRGRYEADEQVLAWAEVDRTDDLLGTLAGMSGGPVFDNQGAVIGVTIAESPRRGRIYTTAPETVTAFLDEMGVTSAPASARPIAAATYQNEAKRLRADLSVVKVVCRVAEGDF